MKTKLKASQEYERVWGEVRSLVDRQITEGNTDTTSIVSEVMAVPAARFLSGRRFRHYYRRVGIRLDKDGRPAERIAVLDGEYRVVPFGGFRDQVVTTLLDFLSAHGDDVDCVVELGSGIGRYLFALFHAARDRLPGEIELHACELTEAGRKISETLRGLCPGMNLAIHPFDYYDPDLSFLQDNRNVLFFTVHSIEQITELSPALFDEMITRFAKCSCFHFEPVGWQFDQQLREKRRLQDTPAQRTRMSLGRRLRKVGRPFDMVLKTRFDHGFPGIDVTRDDIGRSHRVSRNAAEWSARAEYNSNVVSLLETLEADARITIDREDLNVYGDNPFNPTSIIQWTKKTG